MKAEAWICIMLGCHLSFVRLSPADRILAIKGPLEGEIIALNEGEGYNLRVHFGAERACTAALYVDGQFMLHAEVVISPPVLLLLRHPFWFLHMTMDKQPPFFSIHHS